MSMATVSGRYAAGAAANSTAHPAADDIWSFSVPGQNENAAPDSEKPVVHPSDHSTPYDSRQPLSHSPNSTTRPRTRTTSKASAPSHSTNGISRSNSTDQLSNIVTADWDDGKAKLTPKQSRDRLRAASGDKPRMRRKPSKGVVALLEDDIHEGQESKWIHRDKLAQIESKELAEMGLKLRSSRSVSRVRSTRTTKSSVDIGDDYRSDQPDSTDAEAHDDKRLRTKSPVADHEPQLPTSAFEDQRSDAFADSVSQRNASTPSRPGTSRLPVSRVSPPYETALEEQSPSGEHTRAGSNELNLQKRRLRSQSGSGIHFDPSDNTTLSASPPKLRSVTNPASTNNGVRKLSATGDNQRRPSNNSSPNRPTTRNGSRPLTRNGPRPTTARPEGDAPWLATMYKPDPRLPQDQQMIPTHAKRMAEAQLQAELAERERKAQQANAESEFVLLESENSSSDDKPQQRSSPQLQSSQSRLSSQQDQRLVDTNTSNSPSKRNTAEWPLRTPTPDAQATTTAQHLLENNASHNSPRSDTGSWSHRRTATIDSGSGVHGNYNLMPAIQSQAQQEKALEAQHRRYSSRLGHRRELSDQEWNDNAKQAPVNQPVQLNPSDEKPKKKDGCLSCCVVM